MTFTKTSNRPFAGSFPTLLDSIFNDVEKSFGQRDVASKVPTNVIETEEAFHLQLSAPGRNKNNFSLQLEQGILTIGYDEKANEEQPALKYVRKEFDQVSFKRSFSLDDKIETENIEAKYVNGLLKILLPKKAEIKPSTKSITVL
jgi:HSP20 family protein